MLQGDPEIHQIRDAAGEPIAARLYIPAGRLFIVADGQHRREAARRVREFLTELIANRRPPRTAKFYPAADEPLNGEEMEAWVSVQDTFRSWAVVAYEAHIGLSVDQARQMFTNYCYTKAEKADLNPSFDQSNPINTFAKEWLKAH